MRIKFNESFKFIRLSLQEHTCAEVTDKNNEKRKETEEKENYLSICLLVTHIEVL